MNALASYIGTCPYNKEDECAQFTIDDLTDPFVLYSIATVGQEYTFSFWVKSDVEADITACNNTFSTFTDWFQHSVTFTANSTDITFSFGAVGTYYIYRPQLEIGNKASDWTPNPEDVDEAITEVRSDLQTELNEQSAEIIQTSEGIFMSALERYVKTDEFATYKTDMDIRADAIEMEFTEQITKTNDNVSDLNDEVNSEFEERKQFITYSVGGITLHSGDNTKTLQLNNKDGILFQKNGEDIGNWDGENFYTGNIVIRTTERAQFGDFGFIPRSDGSLSFLKIADSTTPFTTLVDGVLTLYNITSSIEDHVLTLDGVTASIGTDENGNNTLTIGG